MEVDVISESINQSDDENEMNIINVKRKSRPINRVIDSDSDDDNEQTEKNIDLKILPDVNPEDSGLKTTQELIRNDSSSHEDNGISEHSDDEILIHNKSFPDEESAPEARTISEGAEIENFGYGTARVFCHFNYCNFLTIFCEFQKRLLNLIDSESSEDEREEAGSASVEQIGNIQKNAINTERDEFGEPIIKAVVYKPMRKKKGDKPKTVLLLLFSYCSFWFCFENQLFFVFGL